MNVTLAVYTYPHPTDKKADFREQLSQKTLVYPTSKPRLSFLSMSMLPTPHPQAGYWAIIAHTPSGLVTFLGQKLLLLFI